MDTSPDIAQPAAPAAPKPAWKSKTILGIALAAISQVLSAPELSQAVSLNADQAEIARLLGTLGGLALATWGRRSARAPIAFSRTVQFLFALGLGSALLGTMPGCSTGQMTPAQKDALTAGAVRIATEGIVTPVLANNPKLEPAVLALAAAVDGLTGDQVLDAPRIAAFVATFGRQWSLSPAEQALIAQGLADLWQLYTATTGATTAPISDPRVVQLLAAFRSGIANSVALHHALQAQPAG